MNAGIDYSIIDHVESFRTNDRIEAGENGEFVGRIKELLPNGKARVETRWGQFTVDLKTAKKLEETETSLQRFPITERFNRAESLPFDSDDGPANYPSLDPVNYYHELDSSICEKCNGTLTMGGVCADCGTRYLH